MAEPGCGLSMWSAFCTLSWFHKRRNLRSGAPLAQVRHGIAGAQASRAGPWGALGWAPRPPSVRPRRLWPIKAPDGVDEHAHLPATSLFYNISIASMVRRTMFPVSLGG